MDDKEKADLQSRFGSGYLYAVSVNLAYGLPPSREKALMLTHLEEVQMWYLKATRAGA